MQKSSSLQTPSGPTLKNKVSNSALSASRVFSTPASLYTDTADTLRTARMWLKDHIGPRVLARGTDMDIKSYNGYVDEYNRFLNRATTCSQNKFQGAKDLLNAANQWRDKLLKETFATKLMVPGEGSFNHSDVVKGTGLPDPLNRMVRQHAPPPVVQNYSIPHQWNPPTVDGYTPSLTSLPDQRASPGDAASPAFPGHLAAASSARTIAHLPGYSGSARQADALSMRSETGASSTTSHSSGSIAASGGTFGSAEGRPSVESLGRNLYRDAANNTFDADDYPETLSSSRSVRSGGGIGASDSASLKFFATSAIRSGFEHGHGGFPPGSGAGHRASIDSSASSSEYFSPRQSIDSHSVGGHQLAHSSTSYLSSGLHRDALPSDISHAMGVMQVSPPYHGVPPTHPGQQRQGPSLTTHAAQALHLTHAGGLPGGLQQPHAAGAPSLHLPQPSTIPAAPPAASQTPASSRRFRPPVNNVNSAPGA